MSYVVGNADVIKDPFVVEELLRIQAFLKGTAEQPRPEVPDIPVAPQKNQPDDPDDPGGPGGGSVTLGQRWLSGPWIIGYQGASVSNGGIPQWPQYSVCRSATEFAANQHNLNVPGMASAVLVELRSSVDIDITGVQEKFSPNSGDERRILGIQNINPNGKVITLVNRSTQSEERNRFVWSSTADERIDIPAGFNVWLIYSPWLDGWTLFGVPAVGADNLPPSLTPDTDSIFPPDFHWLGSQMSINTASAAGIRSIYENTPVFTEGTGLGGTVIEDGFGIGLLGSTSTVVGNGAGVQAAVVPPRVSRQMELIWTTILRAGVNISDVRIWVVLSTNAPTNADDFGGSLMGFRYSTVAGDPGWVGVCRDGATQSVSGIVAAIAVGVAYRLKLRATLTSVFFSVNGGDEVEMTTNLPGSATALAWYCLVFTDAAAAKTMTWYRHHLRGLSSP